MRTPGRPRRHRRSSNCRRPAPSPAWPSGSSRAPSRSSPSTPRTTSPAARDLDRPPRHAARATSRPCIPGRGGHRRRHLPARRDLDRGRPRSRPVRSRPHRHPAGSTSRSPRTTRARSPNGSPTTTTRSARAAPRPHRRSTHEHHRQPDRRNGTPPALARAHQRRTRRRWSTPTTHGSGTGSGSPTRRIAAGDETVADMADRRRRQGAGQLRPDRGRHRPGRRRHLHLGGPDARTSPRRVAAGLGITAPGAYDVNTACSGFSYALASADHAIRAGAARNAIVIGAEKLSEFTDWTDRSTCIIFGDGAGAAVVRRRRRAGHRPGALGFGAGEERRRSPSRAGARTSQQEGQAVFRWATTALAPMAREACAAGRRRPGGARRLRAAPGQRRASSTARPADRAARTR